MFIFGAELEFDFSDADQAEVYEREVRRVVERVKDKRQYDGKRNAEGIRIQCGILDDFFDAVFGAGTADRLFRGKASLREHLEAFSGVLDAAKESRDDLFALANKYSADRAEQGQLQNRQPVQECNRFQGNKTSQYNGSGKGGKNKNRNRGG